MKRTNALRRMLKGMTETFNEGQTIDVEFDDGAYADIDGEYVAVAPNVNNWLGRDLSGPEELRLVVNALSHEVEHVRESNLRAKKDIMDYYEVQYHDSYDESNLPLPRGHRHSTREAKIAGHVFNILEDQYIDWHRTERFRGLRKSHAFFVETQMSGRRLSKIDGKPVGEQLVSGLFQVAIAGYAKGVKDMAADNPDDEVLQFLAWARPHIEACRYEHDEEQRLAIAKRVTNALIDALPEDDSSALEDLLDQLPLEGDADVEDAQGGGFDVDDADYDGDLPESPDDADGDADADEEGEGDEEGDEGAGGAGEPDDDSDAEGGEDGDHDSPETEYGDVPDDAEKYDGDAEIDHESLYDEADDDGNIHVDEGDEEDGDTATGGSGIGNDDPGTAKEDVDDFESAKDERAEEADGEFDFDSVISAMSDAEDSDAAKEWAGVAEDAELGVSDADKRKYEQIRDEVKREQTPMEKAKRDRDERAEDNQKSAGYRFVNADSVREYMNRTGMAKDVRRAFRELATQDDEFTSDEGHKIDVRNAIEHMSGNYGQTELYVDEHEAAHGGRLVGATVDMSGSMSAHEKQAKAALGALNLATHEIGDTFCANTFFTYRDNFNKKKPTTKLITAPGEEFEWDHLDSFTAEALDPMAKGVRDLAEIMKTQEAREKVMFVVADGKPTLTSDGYHNSTKAVPEAAEAVQEVRAEGFVVIGLGIGNVSEENMQRIFGMTGNSKGYIMGDSGKLATELVEIYKKQLGVKAVEY